MCLKVICMPSLLRMCMGDPLKLEAQDIGNDFSRELGELA